MSYKNTIKQAQDLARSVKDSDAQTKALAFGSICSLLDLAEMESGTDLQSVQIKKELFKHCFEPEGNLGAFSYSLGALRL